MKQRLMTIWLLLSLCLTALPVAATESALPQSDSREMVDLTPQDAEALTVYDRLYVGADGSKTANGGKLIGLYTAFAGESSVSLAEGRWKNKMQGDGSLDALLRDTADGVDFSLDAGGGVGYRMTAAQWQASAKRIGITLPETWVALSDFTVEHAASVYPVESGSTLAALYSAVHLGLLKGLFLPSDGTSTANERFCIRWSIAKAQGWVNTAIKDAEFSYRENGAQVAAYIKRTDDTHVRYTLSYSIGGQYEMKPLTLAEYAAEDAKSATATTPIFSLFNGMPCTVYAIRVYDAPLTEAEREQNAFVDLLACAGLDPQVYSGLDETQRAVLARCLSTLSLDTDRETVANAVDALTAAWEGKESDNLSLYVREGLTLLTTAYADYNTGYIRTSGGTLWINAVGKESNATLRGGNWQASEGGFTVTQTPTEFHASNEYGVYLPEELLPRGEYTVETVFTPTGLTVEENGERVRYIDDQTPNGTYRDKSIAIGPLRALQFVSYRPEGKNGQMERRFCYAEAGGWLDRAVMENIDTSWRDLKWGETVSYTILHSLDEGAPSYRMLHNGVGSLWYRLSSEEYIAPSAAGNLFQLLVGMPGTVYAVRVYERVLSDAELAQNRAADFALLYGLDVAPLALLASFDNAAFFSAFGDVSFALTKEEAAKEYERRLGISFLLYEGVGVRKDDKDGLRYYFSLPEGMENGLPDGWQIEVGALANVAQDTMPLLTENGAAARITALRNGEREEGFFLDKNTFSLTLLYNNVDKSLALANVLVCGYVRLVSPKAEEYTFYSYPVEETDPISLFHACHLLSQTDTVKASPQVAERLERVLSACYENITVCVQAGVAYGDGSAASPYGDLAVAFDKCKQILSKTNYPTRLTLLIGDGEYSMHQPLTLSGEAMTYEFLSFRVTSANGRTVLTTTKEIGSDFAPYADNVWVCSLVSENGEYPAFRYLYADGEMQSVAYNGGRSIFEEELAITAFDRHYDALWGAVEAMYLEGTLAKDTVAPTEYAHLATDFEDYKMKFLALGQVERMLKDKTLRLDTLPEGEGEVYAAFFEEAKMRALTLDEIRYICSRMTGTTAEKHLLFESIEPTRYPESEAYREAFLVLRDTIVEDKRIGGFTYYDPKVPSMGLEKGKYYLPLALVAPLRETAEKAMEEGADVKSNLSFLRVEMHAEGQWWYNILALSGVDFSDVAVDDKGDPHVACYPDAEEYEQYFGREDYPTNNRYVCLKNAPCFLDSEGEYYYDRADGKLYYYSEKDPSDRCLAYATADSILRLSGVRHMTVEGITFTGTDDLGLSEGPACLDLGGIAKGVGGLHMSPDRYALYLDDCYGLTVKSCRFDMLGAGAIGGEGMIESVVVEGNEFTSLGAAAIHLGGSTAERKYTEGKWYIRDVLITENYIYDVAKEYHNASAIWLHYGKDVRITYNTVDTCTYTAISLGFNFTTPTWQAGNEYHVYGAEIAYNYVTNFMHGTGDGGAIYTPGGNSSAKDGRLFNSVHHNYVVMSKNTGDRLGHMIVGIYFDGATSNWHCYENVVAEQSYGAVAGEADELFAAGDPYAMGIRANYAKSTFIYLQHVAGALAHNILCENNYVLNVRATDPDAQRTEVYKKYLTDERNLTEVGTKYERGVIPSGEAACIMREAGCAAHKGDPALLANNDY